MNFYLIVKSLHLIATISWMAGLLYLLDFVYHVENYEKTQTTDIFEIMKASLYHIMRPAMLFSWILIIQFI